MGIPALFFPVSQEMEISSKVDGGDGGDGGLFGKLDYQPLFGKWTRAPEIEPTYLDDALGTAVDKNKAEIPIVGASTWIWFSSLWSQMCLISPLRSLLY